MKVPFVDLHIQHEQIMPELKSALDEVINRCDFVSGEAVRLFEKEFAQFCGAKRAVGCSSGTTALHLALVGCGIKAGDEVITTPHTFSATAEAIVQAGAKPVFVDIDERTFNVDSKKIEAAISKKTRAIIPVYLYGQAANLDPILSLSQKYNLKLIADAAQAHGATYQKNKIASLADVTCFSFYPGKNLGAFGDGGMIVTNDAEMADFMKALSDHGRKQKYEHFISGYNYRLNTLQAAVLRVKLKYLNASNQWRKKISNYYKKALQTCQNIVLPFERKEDSHVYHLFVIRTQQRDSLQKFLKEKNIATSIHYPIPLHLQPAYKALGYKSGDFPVTERIAKEILSLPIFPYMSLKQADCVINQIKSFFEKQC